MGFVYPVEIKIVANKGMSITEILQKVAELKELNPNLVVKIEVEW